MELNWLRVDTTLGSKVPRIQGLKLDRTHCRVFEDLDYYHEMYHVYLNFEKELMI